MKPNSKQNINYPALADILAELLHTERMKTMKTTMNMRAVLATLLALTMVFAFAGCGATVPNEEFLALQAEMEAVQAEVETLRTDKETLQTEIDRLMEENDGLTEELEALLAQLEAIEETLEVAEETLETTSSAIETAVASSTASSSSSSSSSAPAVSQTSSKPNSSTSSTAQASANGTGVFAGYSVTVNDKATTATTSGSPDWPIKTYYFYSSSGKTLGSITGDAYEKIMTKYGVNSDAPANSGDWTVWFAEQFNSHRGVSGGGSSGSGSGGRGSSNNFDTAAAASELVRLTNKIRGENGLSPLSVSSAATELASVRAMEIAQYYSHVRPNGGSVANDGYLEIIYRSPKTAQGAMDGWMASSGHREAILDSYSVSFGVGVYQAENGTICWVQLFSMD